jgi:PhzF family phenazine biosynthesis protein
MSSRAYEFVQVDVFTKTALTGNPLAIFPDARGLTDEQMQAIAREMNLSETTFILPREPKVEAEKGTRVRIFTVEEELPFAGHCRGMKSLLRSAEAPIKSLLNGRAKSFPPGCLLGSCQSAM